MNTPERNETYHKELEEALPGLVSKLKDLTDGLDPEERAVFRDIILSAARHSEIMQAHSQGGKDILYMKPVQVIPNTVLKEEYIKLPETLGLT